MPLNEDARTLFFLYKDKPIVGLIHKNTRVIVLAPCIPQKVSLTLNNEGEAISGRFIKNNFVVTHEVNPDELLQFNALLKENHVPRLAYTEEFDEKSAHELLFEQKCKSTKKSEWGGFALKLDSLGHLNYTFVSGAFNSPTSKRIKGAKLSQELIDEVKKQTVDLVVKSENSEINENTLLTSQTGEPFSSSPCGLTTPQKRRKFETNSSGSPETSNVAFSGLFFSTNVTCAKAAIEENVNDISPLNMPYR